MAHCQDPLQPACGGLCGSQETEVLGFPLPFLYFFLFLEKEKKLWNCKKRKKNPLPPGGTGKAIFLFYLCMKKEMSVSEKCCPICFQCPVVVRPLCTSTRPCGTAGRLPWGWLRRVVTGIADVHRLLARFN